MNHQVSLEINPSKRSLAEFTHYYYCNMCKYYNCWYLGDSFKGRTKGSDVDSMEGAFRKFSCPGMNGITEHLKVCSVW
jgi:hypothetical protein